jgi:type II secretory pathway pseudopilin PulG
MRRLPRWWPRDRRQAQSGATLVELLVSVVIMGLALTIVIGTFSTGLLDSALAKRNTAATAVVQYELDRIGGAKYGALPPQYSECFATENAGTPPTMVGFQAACASSHSLRADVQIVPGGPTNRELWSVTVVSLSNGALVGKAVETIKVDHK